MNAHSEDVLAYLVNDACVLAAHWEQAPFFSTDLPGLGSVFSLETVEQLIFSGALPLPCVRLFRDGAALPVDRLGRPAERAASTRERLVDGAAVLAELARGATLVVEELQTYCPPLAEFTAALTARTGYRTYCAAFVTPTTSRGVDPHYDTASVFIRQLDGSKRWRVAKPPQRWPAHEWSSRTDVNTEAVLEVELQAGQCLYIPRGFIHSGVATEQASVHLSIGLVPPTWAALLRRLTETALSDEPFREALPYGFAAMDDAKLHVLLAERIAMLGERLEHLADGAAGTRALAQVKPKPSDRAFVPGSLRSALADPLAE
jgi:bifunctional lysine-specific demethylase and histidyl-hydroxylase NO66